MAVLRHLAAHDLLKSWAQEDNFLPYKADPWRAPDALMSYTRFVPTAGGMQDRALARSVSKSTRRSAEEVLVEHVAVGVAEVAVHAGPKAAEG